MKILGGLRNMCSDMYHAYFSSPTSKNTERFCAAYVNRSGVASKTLDLGCGKTPKNPFDATELYGLDVDYGIDEKIKIFPCDLGVERMPFDDNTFDYVTAFDLLEHIPRLVYVGERREYPFIQLMNEIHRVLKRGGLFLSDTPAYPRISAFTDPTHVNYITSQTFKMYFCNPFNWAQRYGFQGQFDLEKQSWNGANLLTLMSK